MATGDGLLVRLTPIGTMPLDAFAELCAAARLHGNGIIEVTARGNIQVRGLNAASASSFAASVAALDIAAADGLSVLINPLAGLDPEEIIDAGALAADLRLALARCSLAPRLGAKVSVAIDGGGPLNLDSLAADVRLCAMAINDGAALRVGLGGHGADATELGLIAPTDGVTAVTRLLEVLAQGGRDARARDVLAMEGSAAFRATIADFLLTPARPRESGDPASPAANMGSHLGSRLRGNERGVHPARRTTEAIGVHRLRDGSFACGIGLAFGHADATSLERLTEAARAAGASGMRAASGRTLITIGLTQQTPSSFAAVAENLGFIVRGDDPRRHVVACPGAPNCASAEIAARAIGPLIAATAAPHLDGSFKIHISGCAKGCAHPAPAALTIVGTPAGCALVANGSSRDAALKILPADELPAAIAILARDIKHEGGHV
jgi:precorrin-3B synthase